MPSAEELYTKHAPLLYGMATRLADGPCAEEAFHDACVELWGTEARRAVASTTVHMLQVTIRCVRARCLAGGTTHLFTQRLAGLAATMRLRAEQPHAEEFGPPSADRSPMSR